MKDYTWTVALYSENDFDKNKEHYRTKEDAICKTRKIIENINKNRIDGELYVKEIDAILENDDLPITEFYVGQIVDFEPYIWACDVLEDMQDLAYDFAGDFADGYLEDVTKEEENDLSNRLTKVFDEWMKERREQASFFCIEGVTLVKVCGDDE